jgi:hypothetical protein
MKKFLICFITLTFGLSCTKEQMSVCGCSPIASHVAFIVKNKQNTDLLDPAVSGSFNKNNIKIRYKQNDALKDVSFVIREPFYYGANADTKFPYHQIVSSELADLRISNTAKEFYVYLGEQPVDTLSFDFAQGLTDNVKVNHVLQTKEPSLPDAYGKIYYLLK